MSDYSPPQEASSPPVPLFVFGVARSGTSFMYELLNSHPRMRLSYEGRIVREGSYLYGRRRNLQDRTEFGKLLEDFCRCEEEQPLNQWMIDVMQEYGDELFRRHTQEPSLAKLIENIYMLPDPVPCWGNKILRVEECPELLSIWPNAKAVILIRDPRAVYSSQRKAFPKMRVGRARARYSTIYWNLHSAWTRRHATDAEHCFVLPYEDFVEDAPGSLERILKLAGVWDARTAEEMLEAHPAHKGSLTKWRKSLSPKQVRTIESYCFEEMQRWSYAPEIADRPKRMGVVSKALETFLEYAGSVPLDPAWWRRKRLFSRFWRTLRG